MPIGLLHVAIPPKVVLEWHLNGHAHEPSCEDDRHAPAGKVSRRTKSGPQGMGWVDSTNTSGVVKLMRIERSTLIGTAVAIALFGGNLQARAQQQPATKDDGKQD